MKPEAGKPDLLPDRCRHNLLQLVKFTILKKEWTMPFSANLAYHILALVAIPGFREI